MNQSIVSNTHISEFLLYSGMVSSQTCLVIQTRWPSCIASTKSHDDGQISHATILDFGKTLTRFIMPHYCISLRCMAFQAIYWIYCSSSVTAVLSSTWALPSPYPSPPHMFTLKAQFMGPYYFWSTSTTSVSPVPHCKVCDGVTTINTENGCLQRVIDKANACLVVCSIPVNGVKCVFMPFGDGAHRQSFISEHSELARVDGHKVLWFPLYTACLSLVTRSSLENWPFESYA